MGACCSCFQDGDKATPLIAGEVRSEQAEKMRAQFVKQYEASKEAKRDKRRQRRGRGRKRVPDIEEEANAAGVDMSAAVAATASVSTTRGEAPATTQPASARGSRKGPSPAAAAALAADAAAVDAVRAATAAAGASAERPPSPTASDYSETPSEIIAQGAAGVERELSAEEYAMLTQFRNMLGEGVALKKHGRAGKPRVNTISVDDAAEVLSWDNSARKVVGGARKADSERSMPLHEITAVKKGKSTATFHRRTAAKADPQCCLSLITATRSLDMEAGSPEERDAMVQGFTMLVADAQRRKAVSEERAAATARRGVVRR